MRPRIPPDRPDPAIYSQAEQFANGVTPTWNSPDITTNFLSPWKLMPESKVVVRNLSATASGIGVQVAMSTSAFGIGMVRTPLSTHVINLAPSQQVELLFALSQALLNGDQLIGAYIDIYHPKDKVAINSHGAQLIAEINTSQSGRNPTVHFPVLNQGAARQISLSVLPNNLSATVTPLNHFFSAFQQIQAALSLHVPSNLHNAREEVAVAGWSGGELIGGLTYIVRVDD